MKKWIILAFTALFFLDNSVIYGQGGSLSLKLDKDSIRIDEVLKVEFTLDNLTGNFRPPQFDGFQIVSGPNTSSSFTMINGEVSQKKTYSFVLIPKSSGILQIGKATLENDQRVLSTDPVDIFVWESDKRPPANDSRQRIFRYDDGSSGTKNQNETNPGKRKLKKI